ncbi:MAG TPA: MvaI/BcnI family restriction endonuclease [Thermoanaerobaculia bacterium]|nr:MvaI/BcnI family restriction endonuclease [Thermoanaerobaculia bacterium]
MTTDSADLSIERLTEIMVSAGAQRIYVKRLARNDNSKNQIYLGPGFEAVNLFPNLKIVATPGQPQFKAPLSFAWIHADGTREVASGAQLILYPQYPEVRLSGFLQGTRTAPSRLMQSREEGRILVLGVDQSGVVLAHAAPAGSALEQSLRAVEGKETVGVFFAIPVDGSQGRNSRERLLAELSRIHGMGWIRSKRLKSDGTMGECEAPNCGGYTLEAELGIRPNGFSDPDFLGWELKQHGVTSFEKPPTGAITLMTPEPTGGYYRVEGPSNFIERFGYPDKRGRPSRWNFGGIHTATRRHGGTGLMLSVEGFDPGTKKIGDPRGVVALVSASGEVAASWAFSSLMEHWNRKHALAAFVPSLVRKQPELSYLFGSPVRLGEVTYFLLFLSAVAEGEVFYDPGLKLVRGESLKVKRRSQFRIRASRIELLYKRVETCDLDAIPKR